MAIMAIPKKKGGAKPKDELDKLAKRLKDLNFDPVERMVEIVRTTGNERIQADICLKLLDYLFAKAKANAGEGGEGASIVLNLGGDGD